MLLIFHRFTLITSTLKLDVKFLLFILAVTLQLGFLFSKFNFLVNHCGDNGNFVLFDRARGDLLIKRSLITLHFVDLGLVLAQSISEVFSFNLECFGSDFHLLSLKFLLFQTLCKLFNFLLVILFLIVVESNNIVLRIVLFHCFVLSDVRCNRFDVIHQSGLQVLTSDSNSFATDF